MKSCITGKENQYFSNALKRTPSLPERQIEDLVREKINFWKNSKKIHFCPEIWLKIVAARERKNTRYAAPDSKSFDIAGLDNS